MKKRDFSYFVQSDPEVKSLLDALARPADEVDQDHYRELMRDVGKHLAKGLLSEGGASFRDKNICVVCTVEDADFLASGVIDGLLSGGVGAERIYLQCFWNDKVREGVVSLSPVSRQYAEPFDTARASYIIVKSIISGACVVKTNLTRALSNDVGADIYVAAPVLLDGAQGRLQREFPESMSSRFKYVWFATDYEKDGEDVIPGIGGSVYGRLGLGDEVTKNRYVPEIVKSRRRLRFHVPQSLGAGA